MTTAGLRRAALITADTFIYLCFGVLWVSVASSAVAFIGRRAWGNDSPVVSAASAFSQDVLIYALLLTPIAPFLCGLRAVYPKSSDNDNNIDAKKLKDGKAITDQGRLFRVVLREMLKDPVIVGALAFMPFFYLLLAGQMMGSSSCVGAMMIDVGTVGAIAMCCFIMIPSSILQVWRMK